MTKQFFTLLAALMLSLCAMTQTVANDTLQLAVTSIEAEPDPNNREWIFSLFGTTGTQSYKIQIDFHSASMYGTFSDTDFDLAGEGKNHNFIRTSDGMNFWQFKHLDATVSDSVGATIVSVNGLIQVGSLWRRVLAKGVIAAPAPKDTVAIEMGQVTVVPMDYFGFQYLRLDAATGAYSLAFGINNLSSLCAGTYYQADLLRPDLVRLPADTLAPVDATLVVTDLPNGYHHLQLDLRGTNDTLYSLSMHTAEVVPTDTLDVVCTSGQMQNLESMYNMFQFAGQGADYQVAIGVTPGVIHESLRSFTNDSVNLRYTNILRLADQTIIPIMHAEGSFEVDSVSSMFPMVIVHADLLGVNGTLYRVTLPVGGSELPTAEDTIYVDCGDQVGRLDYTFAAGFLGLVLAAENVDVHVLVYNGLMMSGTFTKDMFYYNDDVPGENYVAYVTTYEGNVFRLDNVLAAEMRMDSIGDTVHIALNVVTEHRHMYCFSANLLPMRALTGEEVSYNINDPETQDGMLVAFLLDKQGDESLFYMQAQRSDEWDEETGEPTGDNNEVWSFVFVQDSIDGISGTYGYSAGTLSDEYHHELKEQGTEIWLQPMAGTLQVKALREVVLPASALGFEYRTHLYSLEANMAMTNGIVYHVSGENILFCVDYETEQYLELSEEVLSALNDVLLEQGLHVKKVLRNGMILLETTDHIYNVQGQMVR